MSAEAPATTIELYPDQFGPLRRVILRHQGITVTGWRYASGVCAIEIEHGGGTVVALPFQGQQIWDAVWRGRRLTMTSFFEEPQPTQDYLRNYGAFFIHCGGVTMGNPGPEDRHPLHGELPSLNYSVARIECGSDDRGPFVVLTGEAHDRLSFAHHFIARPRLRVTLGEGVYDMDVLVENAGGTEMPYMYLAHINFAPAPGARLVDTLRDDRRDLAIRPIPQPANAGPERLRWHAEVAADPARHREIRPGDIIMYEGVFTMQPPAGPDGWTHALQVLPDGSADLVSYGAEEMPYAVRWMCRSPDRQALGFVLPATAAPDGRTAAERNGQLVWLAPGQVWHGRMRFGALDAAGADAVAGQIAAIRDAGA